MNLLDRVREGLFRNPSAPAAIHQDKVITAGAFYSLFCEVTRRLHSMKVVEGDVVGVTMDHSPLHCAVLLALARLGAVSLPLHPNLPLSGRAELSKKFAVSKIIGPEKAGDVEGIPSIRLGAFDLRSANDDLDEITFTPDESTPARIALTSGTTGMPSGILYTHGYWIERIENTVDAVDSSSRVIPGDLHLTLGNLFAFAALMNGGVMVFQRTLNLQDFLASINLHAVTHAMMPPAVVSQIIPHLPREGTLFPTLKHLRIVGGDLPASMSKTLLSRFSPNIYYPYGISEIGAISMADPELLATRSGCAGVARPGVCIEVVGETGQPVIAGASGEIRVSRPGMPQGYYQDPEKTAQKFRDGWFYTGDIGHLDADGALFIEGRIDDRINVGGKKFNPVNIESLLCKHPQVKDAAVFPFEMESGAKVIAAAIVSERADIEAELPDFCKTAGMGELTPQRFMLINELPRNPSGKLVRTALSGLFPFKSDELTGRCL